MSLRLLFLVRFANQATIRDVALCHKKFGDHWLIRQLSTNDKESTKGNNEVT